jgi:cysteinyl-tRNA synthetase
MVNLMIQFRNALRQRKLFDLADMMRAGLEHELGIVFEDTPEGTKWRFK